MISLRPGSHAFRLLQILAIAGEYPASALSLLGNERTLSDLVRKLEVKQFVKLGKGRAVGPLQLIRVIGKRPNRTIRLEMDAVPLLDMVHSGLTEYYLDTYYNHHLPSNQLYILRNHRVAEATACFMAAGIEFRPFLLPQLQNEEIKTVIPDWPRFYSAKAVKQLSGDEFNKTMYSRMVGAVFYQGGQYTVYNTRSTAMRWKGLGEIKAAVSLDELARWNNGAQPSIVGSYSALLFGRTQDIALETLREAAKDRVRSNHFNRIYYHIHFIPLGDDGIRLLRILTTPDWNEKILDSIFPPDMRIKTASNFDAQRGGTFYVSHLDSDIAKLIRVKQSAAKEPLSFVCFPWQAEFIASYFGSDVEKRVVDIDWVEVMLGLK